MNDLDAFRSHASPCVGLCQLDEHDVCRGCFRSRAEVAAWSRADRGMIAEMLRRVAARRAAAGESLRGASSTK